MTPAQQARHAQAVAFILTPEAAKTWAAQSEKFLYCDLLITALDLNATTARVDLLEAVYSAYLAEVA